MEPAFSRGDILFMEHNSMLIPNRNYSAGDIIAFNNGGPIPIVHRILQVYGPNSTGEYKILTKGDNNRELKFFLTLIYFRDTR